MAPTASAAAAESSQSVTAISGKGQLFLKANVPEDFYDIVCVTLKDKSTDKEFTLKVEGGTVFEVNISLSVGEYEVISAYVEEDDSYSVFFQESEIAVSKNTTASLILDVQPKSEIENMVPSSTTPSSEPESENVEQDVAPEESTQSDSDPNAVESSDILPDAEADTEPESGEASTEAESEKEENSSGGFLNILLNIIIYIVGAGVFFALLVLFVLFVRNKLNDN